jgi:hypothetical protein
MNTNIRLLAKGNLELALSEALQAERQQCVQICRSFRQSENRLLLGVGLAVNHQQTRMSQRQTLVFKQLCNSIWRPNANSF